MLKLLKKLKNLYSNKFLDVTREDDEFETVESPSWGKRQSRIAIVADDLTFKQRISALIFGRCVVRLKNRQIQVIKNYRLAYED